MLDINAYLTVLEELVRINTISPMCADSVAQVNKFFVRFGLQQYGEEAVWLKQCDNSDVWIYCHVDTKPIGELSDWNSDPFDLTRHGEDLYGRGVSDSKFQLINVLDTYKDLPVNIIVDGGEEIGMDSAATIFNKFKARKLVVVDGTSPSGTEIYNGLSGQMDGRFNLDTGDFPIHPGREKRSELWTILENTIQSVSDLHFNITRIRGGTYPRSLTLESVDIDFDLRYDEKSRTRAEAFLSSSGATLRQHYKPLNGQEIQKSDLIAPFSSVLGNHINPVFEILVIPGGRSDNRAHQSNEMIALSQIHQHQTLLAESKERILK